MSIGATLGAARRRCGLSLSEVTAVTRVREPVIEAMERDDFSGCGGDFYARAHIRSVARAVGVDPAPLVAEYDEQVGRANAPAAHEIFEPDVMPARSGGPNWSVALAVALLLVVGYGLVAVFAGGSAGRTGDSTVTSAATGAAKAGGTVRRQGAAGHPATRRPQAGPSHRSTPTPRAAAAVVEIRLTATARSWVNASGTDGSQIFRGLLEAGDRKVFRHAKGIRLVLGNADGVRLVVNGYDLGSPHTETGVLRATYRPGKPDHAVAATSGEGRSGVGAAPGD